MIVYQRNDAEELGRITRLLLIQDVFKKNLKRRKRERKTLMTSVSFSHLCKESSTLIKQLCFILGKKKPMDYEFQHISVLVVYKVSISTTQLRH